MIADINQEIPTTLLAFFPSYKLDNVRKPTFEEIMTSYEVMQGEGLTNIRLGNIGVFAKTEEQLQKVLSLRHNL